MLPPLPFPARPAQDREGLFPRGYFTIRRFPARPGAWADAPNVPEEVDLRIYQPFTWRARPRREAARRAFIPNLYNFGLKH
jgi:hypothetical protein